MTGNPERKLTEIMADLEEKWMQASVSFIQNLFEKTFLPSHDLAHHLRTWNYAKQILFELENSGNVSEASCVEAILLSTLFHDTGLSVTHQINHGAFSKDFFIKFIEQSEFKKPEKYAEILHAIEYHDKKESDLLVPISSVDTPDILSVTSIADDIDAMGTIGIYRYIEIYSQREVRLKDIGIQILMNASSRMNTIRRSIRILPETISCVEKKYQELVDFFDNYNQQTLLENTPEDVKNGHLGIVNCIKELCIQKKIRPEYIAEQEYGLYSGKLIENYFADLKKKIQNFRHC